MKRVASVETEACPAKFALRHHWLVQQSGPGDSRSSVNVLKRRNERLVAEELGHARPLTPAGLTYASGSVAVRLSPAELPNRAENGDDRVVTSLRGARRYVSQVRAGLLAVVGLLAVAGCGGTHSGSESPDVLRVLAWGTEGSKLDDMAAQFTREHPGINVRITSVTSSAAHDKLLVGIAGGEVPDVAVVGASYMAALAHTHALEKA